MPDLRVRALQLLTRREYSRAALKAKLAAHAESEEELNAVLDSLQAERLLSDQRYAAERVAARGARYGNARLRQELRQQGIGDDEIAAALPEAGDEGARCRQVWQRKFTHLPDSPAERARQQRFLHYRGFSSAAIRCVLRGDDES
ncbi:recombination regulator RecX [Dechloromonas sp. ZY10]|uniref:recombination regulator RecX n=1 Tax=Dechloromonas aquae TaxID=2664436 RepID=UPI003529CB2C